MAQPEPSPDSGSLSRCSSGRSGASGSPFQASWLLPGQDLHRGAVLVQQRRRLQRRLASADDDDLPAAERRQVRVRRAVRAQRRRAARQRRGHVGEVLDADGDDDLPGQYPLDAAQVQLETVVALRPGR